MADESESVNIINLTAENFESELKKIAEGEIGIIDFSATWCGPCSIQHKIIEENLDSIKQLVEMPCSMFSMDIDNDGGISDSFNIQYVPTIVFFFRGRFGKMDSGVKKPEAIADHAKKFIEAVNQKFDSGEYTGGLFDK